MGEAVAALAPDHCEARRDEIVRAFRERSMALRLTATMCEPMFPGAGSLLRSFCRASGCHLGPCHRQIETRCCRAFHRAKRLGRHFHHDPNRRRRPIEATSGRCSSRRWIRPGTLTATTVMIGDTYEDMLMAASANVASIGVTWGYHTKAELRQAGAKTVVHSFAELERALGGRAVLARNCEAMA